MSSSPPDRRDRPRTRHRTYIGAAAAFFGLGIASIVLLPLVIVSAALIAVWVGIPMLALSLQLLRLTSMGYRRVAGRVLRHQVEPPYRRSEARGFIDRFRNRITDPTTYRDLLWLPLAVVVGFPLGITALVFYLVFPVGVFVSPVLLRVFSALAGTVLRRADSEQMAQRIGELSRSRADAVDIQAAELRRIERDLHDGAQARLVALSMNLGLAEQLMDKDPDASRELIAESRQSASVALSDLRGLVRGILPPVLADRGLVGAIQALALGHPGPVEVDLDIQGHPPAPVESAMYFAVAEALSNSAKHAMAQHTWIWGRYTDGRLHLSVGDDGIGGAVLSPQGGLTGLGRRLAAFDGSVAVASPPGGGTIVNLEVPCALSSVRT
ncbi:sensor histidine kinase [Nakamurella sp. YIM 132087]|uniref:histidine kinase n=1 Tax=Nakamurella alba TaxID=2665158 RepID=A0A7K1FIA8_9ACTN|nr:sensor histidine kinase [Nakamurella alba]MTD13820.1 sensor histidine kinase [Nakamurella alba]